MKRKLSLLLAMVLAMTMVMGIGVTAFAADHPDEYNIPVYDQSESGIPRCWAKNEELRKVNTQDGKVTYWIVEGYSEPQPSYLFCLEDSQGQVYAYAPEGYDSPQDIIDELEDGFANMTKDDIYSIIQMFARSTYHREDLCLYGWNAKIGSASTTENSSSPAHVHNFQWQTITAPTQYSDGLEGEVCSCGATRNTQPISAMDYAINKYADQMIKAAKPGQKITLEFGEFNSFPRYMMEKVAARMNDNITFVFKFKQNKKMQTVTIEPGTAIDLQYDWYGPDKMKELYGAE